MSTKTRICKYLGCPCKWFVKPLQKYYIIDAFGKRTWKNTSPYL
jgi:hypothetical protein